MQKTSIAEPQLVKLEKLKPHEEVDVNHLENLKREIESEGILKSAVIADKKTNIILDGEHRFTALKKLNCKTIPVVYVNYDSPLIEVRSRRENFQLTKRDIIEAGLSQRKLPPKTSEHLIKRSTSVTHISAIEKRIDIPLEILKHEVTLVELKPLKTAMCTNLKDALKLYTLFLRKNIVDTPVIVDQKTSVVLDCCEVYQALDLLAVEKVPALMINLQEVEVKSLQPITKEMILDAAVKGRKMPPKSFKILTEPVKIASIPLGKLSSHRTRDRKTLRVYGSTLELLHGSWPTPLVKLNSLSNDERLVFAKLEGLNPFSNSVKDRVGWAMINEALKNGELGDILYEATSTNTGIALTSIANILGVKTRLYIPKTIQKASDTYLKALGADVVRLPINLTVEAISQVEAEAKTNKATHLNQFENDANLKVHLKYTAKELDNQLASLGLKPSYIVGGLGTAGHMSAISLYFKAKYGEKVKIVGAQPAPNEVIPGIRRIETGMKWYHWAQFDEIVDVKQTEAIEGAITTARREGLLIGLSAGAVAHAFNKIASTKGVYVLVFPDTGYKYLEQLERYLQLH